MIAVITMAGLGSRFRDVGYQVPKYEIVVHDRPLFDWSLISLRELINQKCRFVFICLKENDSRKFVNERCLALGIENFDVVEIESITDGQATTVLAAKPFIQSDEGVSIFNIDTHLNPSAVALSRPFHAPSILCFPGKGDAWSFARTDVSGRAVEVTEKVRVSDHASVGLYVFTSWSQYENAYRATYLSPKSALTIKERYIAPIYNALIDEGIRVEVPVIGANDVVPLGTPAEVRNFEAQAGVAFRD